MSKPNILLLEDNSEDGTELIKSLEKYGQITWIKNIENINEKLKIKWDCYVFDDDMYGNKIGKEILINAIKNEQIPRMRAVLFSKYKPDYSLRDFGIVSFVDKAKAGWKTQLVVSIQECLIDSHSDIMLQKMLEEAQCFNDNYSSLLDVHDDFLKISTIGILVSAKTVRDIYILQKKSVDNESLDNINQVTRMDLQEMLRKIYSKKMMKRYSLQ